MLRSKKKFIKMKLSTEKGGATTPTPSTRTQGPPRSAFLRWGAVGKGTGRSHQGDSISSLLI